MLWTKAARMASYAYSTSLLPSLLAMLFIALLSLYGWRHRKVPGAVPFAAACVFGIAWSFGSMLSGAAQEPETKILWLRFATVWQLPLVTAGTCFALQYAGLGHWLTRRVLLALAVPPLIFAAVIATDGLHHLAWAGLTVVDATVRAVYGPFITAELTYSYILFVFNVSVLLWLFVRSPRHRAPVALMVLAQVGARVTFELGVVRSSFPPQWDPDLFVLLVTFGVYAIALFGFHVLNPVPAARRATLTQMRDGMVVVDGDGRIVDVNPGAERALGRRADELLGRPLGAVPALDDLVLPQADTDASDSDQADVGPPARDLNGRHYLVETKSLEDRRSRPLGRLILLHDVTEQQQAQARLLEQERVVATLRERERLARELHDSVGQVLGYVSMQAQTASKCLRDGDAGKAEPLLDRLASVAQQAHADVRESILAPQYRAVGGLGVRAHAAAPPRGLRDAVRRDDGAHGGRPDRRLVSTGGGGATAAGDPGSHDECAPARPRTDHQRRDGTARRHDAHHGGGRRRRIRPARCWAPTATATSAWLHAGADGADRRRRDDRFQPRRRDRECNSTAPWAQDGKDAE